MSQSTGSPSSVDPDADDLAGCAAETRDGIRDGLFTLDHDWRFAYVNERGAGIMGLLPEPMVGRSIWEHYPRLLGTEIERACRAVMRDRLPVRLERARIDSGVYYDVRVFPSTDNGISVYWWERSNRRRAHAVSHRLIDDLSHEIQKLSQNEHTLRENERRLWAVHENGLDRFMILRPFYNDRGDIADFTYAYENARAAKAAGRSPSELTGSRVTDTFPSFQQTRLYAMCKLAAETGQALELEDVDHCSGVDEWYRAAITPVPDGIAVAIHTITEHKRAEEELRKSEERLRALTSASTDVLYRMSPDWTCMAELSGKGFLADTKEPNATWLDKYTHPDDQIFVTGIISECIREKKPFDLEHRVLRENGAIGWTHSRAVPLFDGAGEIKEWFGAASDITERRQAQEVLQATTARLEQAHSLLRGIIESTNDLIMAIDTDFRYLAINEAYRKECQAIYGVDIHVGDSMLEMLAPYPADQKNACDVADPAFRGTPVVTTQVYGDPSRSRRVYELHVSPIRDRQGRIVGAAHINTEITERRRIEEALREADQQKNQFLATLSHELRNPLAAIRASLDVLGRVAPGGERANRAIAVMDRQCGQLTRLVDDLLDVSRITQNKIVLQPERLDLNELLQRVFEDFETVFAANGLRLSSGLSPSPIFLFADRARLAQVFGNLLQNAAKFTPHGGVVTVSTTLEAHAGWAVVRVADTGIGIEPDVIPRLFKPFAQVDTCLERRNGGLGLGLALVSGLIRLHGGEVSVASAGEGQGTEFAVKLPWREDAVEAYEPAASLQGRRRRILIIEDNVDLADTLRELLELEGHEVNTAHSGLEGLMLASQKPPEVLLCDIGMPGMDGFAVGRAFRADARLNGAFLVALTGYSQPEDVAKVIAAGFDRHLAKPVELSTLKSVLGECRE